MVTTRAGATTEPATRSAPMETVDDPSWDETLYWLNRQYAVAPPFPLLRLHPYQRRVVLSFLVSVSPEHATRSIARQIHERNPSDTDHEHPDYVNHGAEMDRRGSMSCTYVSTTACLSTVIHHTRTAHFVCKALRADVEAMETQRLPGARWPVATPRAWLEHLYEQTVESIVPALTGSGEDIIRRSLMRWLNNFATTARQANLVAEMFMRANMHKIRFPHIRTDADRPKNSYETVLQCPASWSAERKRVARRDLPIGGKRWPVYRVRTNEERYGIAPTDPRLLVSLVRTAFQSFAESLNGQIWTAHVTRAQLMWDGTGSVSAGALQRVDLRLDAVFGTARSRNRGGAWIQRWTNVDGTPWDLYESYLADYEDLTEAERVEERVPEMMAEHHDQARPPLTRWQDAFAKKEGGVCLTCRGDDEATASAAKIQVIFAHDVDLTPQEGCVLDGGLIERLHFADVATAMVEGGVAVQSPTFKFETGGSWPYVNAGLLFYNLGDEFRVMMHVCFPSLS
jgi:hypothetical protein